VYLARDTRLDRDVAVAVIKVEGLDGAGRERIEREAQAIARLGAHPNVVTVFDTLEENEQPILVFEYMAGGSLEELLTRTEGHRLPLEQVVAVASQVCQGLEQAHRLGIVHRDLKPGNILFTAEPSTAVQAVACVGDFGLAVALDRSRLSQAGMMV